MGLSYYVISKSSLETFWEFQKTFPHKSLQNKLRKGMFQLEDVVYDFDI